MEVFQVTKEKTYFPAESWQHSTPEEQGMDSNLLTNAISYINSYFKNYYSFIVIKNGYLIFESNNRH